MMRALFDEDQAAHPVDDTGFPRTIEALLDDPSRGQIVLFENGESLQGYALLIPYWSNEFGGTLLFIDEIFVLPDARGRGIGKSFFRFLREKRPYDPAALALEVTPSNDRAYSLYASLGFEKRKNSVLMLRL